MPFGDRGAHPQPRIRPDLAAVRHEMVDVQLARRGIRDAAVLDAMRTVPREAFVPSHLVPCAYDDDPLPIGEGQTISQPYVVAFMIAAVAPTMGDRALEIGTGSGYSAAVLASIVTEVYTVERIAGLADTAAGRLTDLGYRPERPRAVRRRDPWVARTRAVRHHHRDGGRSRVPPPLLAQLAVGGRPSCPLGATSSLNGSCGSLVPRTGPSSSSSWRPWRSCRLSAESRAGLTGAATAGSGGAPGPAEVTSAYRVRSGGGARTELVADARGGL